MKKLLLILATALVSFSGFAQDSVGEDESTITPGWTVRLNITEPDNVVSDVTYTMAQTESQIGNEFVYTYTIKVDVDSSKSSKYYIYVNYTDETGTVKTKNTAALYQAYNDGSIEIAVSAFLDSKGEIQYILSNSKYLLCDTNWTGLGYFDASKDGQPNMIYFNNTNQKGYVAVRNPGAATAEYIPGGNSQYQSNLVVQNNPNGVEGLYKAIFDYSNAKLSFEKVSDLELYIENYIPFVSASNFILPENVKAYRYSEYSEGVLKLTEITENPVMANQPVILCATQPGKYTISLTDEFNFNYIGEVTGGTRAFISDSYDEGSVFYGVHQPHLVPENSFTFDGEKFVKANTSDIITALNCYVKVEDDLESITIEFLEEEDPEEPVEPEEPEDVLYVHFTDANGNHLQTHWTVLEKQDDGSYYNTVDIAGFSYFVLSDANFKGAPTQHEPIIVGSFEGFPANKKWNDLDSDTYIYHVAETAAVLDDDIESSNTTTLVKTKVSDLSDDLFTPFIINTPHFQYYVTLDPEEETLTLTDSGTPTGIDNVSIDATNNNDSRIFNIFGQQVDRNYKGIVIQNGKKFFLR